ncbi:YitT family protein [Virgibacillus sp. MSP4-1]|uniref:YitT family protein n=1 Tax=Virgibacillus sp. MSP4-1 TaxID=2700081 RepID=UPI0003A34780|nr:YitT family protein [Virgibacillus sp. MSP4-1]QHS23274.1 YitT family protein [Virgibacillus sp. MSP4-1]
MMEKRENNHMQFVALEYLYVIFGSFFVAIGFNLFLLPNGVASGGVSGISTLTDELFGWEPAFVQGFLNVPLFIAGVAILGANFGLKSFLGTIMLPIFVYLTREWDPATLNPLLASVFGGILVGAGLGIVFRGRASTGGTDVAAAILHKFTGISLGICMAFIDGLIVTSAAFVFNLEHSLYALVGLFMTSRTIDIIQVGFTTSKNVMIITDNLEEMRKTIFEEIDRGVTILRGEGGYTRENRNIMMCVVDQKEFTKLTKTVNKVDSEAFVIAMSAAEVLGEGFKKQ